MALVSALCLINATAAEHSVRKNKDFKPAAVSSAYNFVTTGCAAKIKSASIAKDGTITARFSVTDSKGQGLDVNGVQTPGTLSIRFVAAFIPNGQSQYTAYTTTVDKATSNTNPSQIQASTDSGGKFTLVDAASGTYDYTFATKAPATIDVTATHSIGMQAERTFPDFGLPGSAADDVFTFVPSGAAVTNVRDVLSEAGCNKCHDPITAHGGGRKTMTYCVLCHTPQSVNPDSNNTVDMKVFIHKLHMGSSLPSVVAGTKYYVVHRGAVNDYSDIKFPQSVTNCTACHVGGGAMKDNWKTNPSRAACGSCHDNINFATGENHINLPEVSDNQCKNCHTPTATSDFDVSIPGAHIVANNSSSLPGIVLKVLKVDGGTPGSSPVVTFSAMNQAGQPYADLSKLTQIRVVLSGPNNDYQYGASGVRVSENPATVNPTSSTGVYTYTMTGKLPAVATGSYTISLQARNNVILQPGTKIEVTASDNALPFEYYFAVDNNPVAGRRQVVASEKCFACHQDLGFVHGGTRGAVQECVICHNPTLTDGTSKQSVSLATQIHSIHRGENLANPYILGTTNYQEVKFPGDLRDCNSCHVNNSYLVENVKAKAPIASPGGFTPTSLPIAAACQGCHDDLPTASHALANTTTLGESCTACHSASSDFSVDKVHARVN